MEMDLEVTPALHGHRMPTEWGTIHNVRWVWPVNTSCGFLEHVASA